MASRSGEKEKHVGRGSAAGDVQHREVRRWREEKLMGGARKSVRQREGWRGEAGWASLVDWAEQKVLGRVRKERRRRGVCWAGLERKREKLCLFFFKHKHHLNDYFEFKQNLNFGCYIGQLTILVGQLTRPNGLWIVWPISVSPL